MTNLQQPILIIGAGITGLTLAQACRKENIAYRLFERDTSATHRSAGWGLTIHWALPVFKSLLPQDILDRLPETYVNRYAVDAGEKGSFTLFDLSTGEAKWRVPAAERIRVSRKRLRALLLTGLNISWGKALEDIEQGNDGVTAVFSDKSKASGCLLVGCDGSHSRVRQLCRPLDYVNNPLPVRFLGAGVRYPENQISEMRELDPFFLQGTDSKTDAFLWFSFLTNPGDIPSDSETESTYQVQIMVSWPYRPGFLGRDSPTEVPDATASQRAWMKYLADGWSEPFRSIVQNIPDDSEIKPIELADYVPRRTVAATNGNVVLTGDAAHTMVMFRGESANHGIVDVSNLLSAIRSLVTNGVSVGEAHAWKEALESYEDEMVERTELAVLASRQACLDANEFKRLNDQSPLVRRRLMRADLEALPN